MRVFTVGTITFPFYLYSSVHMLDSIAFYLQTMLSRFLYFVQPKNILKLKNQRETLVKEVLEFVDLHIREADPRYEQERILFKKEEANGDSEKAIMMHRNSLRKNKKKLSEMVSSLLGSS